MSNQPAQQYLEQGIVAAKAGRKEDARKLLQASLKLNPQSDSAWLWLASVANDKRERLLCLQKALQLNPQNDMAVKAVRALGIEPSQLIGTPPSPPAAERPPAERPPAPLSRLTPPPPTPRPASIHDELASLRGGEEDEEEAGDFSPQPAGSSYSSFDEDFDDETGYAEEEDDFSTFEDASDEEASDEDETFSAAPSGLRTPAMPSERHAASTPTASPEEIAEQIVQAYLAPAEVSNVVWTRKTRRRAGEREIIIFRLQIAAAVLTFLLLVGGALTFAFLNSPQLQLVVLGASETPRPPTATTTNTPTATPGFTPTPSPTRDTTALPTFTASPTVDPFIRFAPRDPRVTLTATRIYPVPPNNLIVTAAGLIAREEYSTAIPVAGTAVAQVARQFDPNPFYYQAIAYAREGQTDAALNTLNEAANRLDNLQGVRAEDVPRFRTLIDAGLSEVYLQQAQDALSRSDTAAATPLIENARALSEQAITGDPLLVRNYVLLAEGYRLQGRYEEALQALDVGLAVPELNNDLNLIAAKAEIHLQQGRSFQRANNLEEANTSFDAAAWQSYIALYINPRTPAAHRVQTEAALELGDPGLAVIYAQGYLLYFPESAEAYRLLGDARTREGNLELALNAYSRAIETSTVESVTEAALISRAALYRQQNRPRLSVRDLTAAIAIADRPSTRALRMNAAYAARNYAFAAEDAQALVGTGAVSDGEALLMQARVQIDRADNGETQAYSEALNLLNNATDLPEPLIPVADEYRARALLALGSYSDALNAINRALVLETGSRHYLRGLIFEGLQQFDQAIAEFNWVLTWSAVYPYPFAEDARAGITRVQETIAELNRQATATSRGATRAALDLTETRSAVTTATAEAATQAAGATATARALPTPTRTPTPGGS